MFPFAPVLSENTEKNIYFKLDLFDICGIYFLAPSAKNFADVSYPCNSPTFNLSVTLLISLISTNSRNTSFSNSFLMSESIFLFQRKYPMDFFGESLDILKVSSVRLTD